MNCPTCLSPREFLHPCKAQGKPLKDVFVSLEHSHSFEDKPVTVVVCNDLFHQNAKGLYWRIDSADMVVATYVHPGSVQNELLEYLRQMHITMNSMALADTDRIPVWQSCAKEIDRMVKKTWG